MIKKQKSNNQIVVYQAKSGALELKRDANADTIWANLDQIARVFGRDKSVVSRHIKNIFKEGELKRNPVFAIFATTAADGKTYNVEYFNLDLILSVGYRVNSKQATLFRDQAAGDKPGGGRSERAARRVVLRHAEVWEREEDR